MYYKQRYPLMDLEYESGKSSSGGNTSGAKKENSLQEISKQEVCSHLEDVKGSELTSRLIKIASQKAGEILDAEKVKKEAVDIYSAIMQKKPITLKEKRYLLEFLSDENLKSIAQNIFSELYILEGDKNTDFLKEYLKDIEGKLTIDKILPIMIEMVAKYQLVIDINGTITEEKRGYFIYTLENGTQSICIPSQNHLFCLPETFQSIEILENVFIVGYTKNVNANKTSEKIAKLYRFTNEEFQNIGNIPDGENISVFDRNKLLFSQGNQKYGLIRYGENEKGEREFKALFPPIYSIVRKRGIFIAGFIEEKPELNYLGKLHIYKENNDSAQQIFSGEALNDTNWDRVFSRGKETPRQKSFNTINILNDSYIEIETSNGKDIYFYDEKIETLIAIESLKGISKIDGDLLGGNLCFVEFSNGKRGQYIFSQGTNQLTCLIEYQSKKIHNDKVFIKDGGRVYIDSKDGYLPIVLIYHNQKIYLLKKGYSCNSDKKGHYVKKGFFGEKIYVKDFSFELLEEYLEEIQETLVL